MGDSHATFLNNHLEGKKANSRANEQETKQRRNAFSRQLPLSSTSSSLSPALSEEKEQLKDGVKDKDVLLQHHYELSLLFRDLEQHKLDMQRQHNCSNNCPHIPSSSSSSSSSSEQALRNFGATTQTKFGQVGQQEDIGTHVSSCPHPVQLPLPPSSSTISRQRGGDSTLRTRKEGRDEHGMNGASSGVFSIAQDLAAAECTKKQEDEQQYHRQRDIWDEELSSECLKTAHNTTEIPELSNSILYSSSVIASSSSGLPPRTIPFRSASFSQVDITSEGKYVRNPKSPITLKPTAFCLMNSNSYASGSSTLPRSSVKHHLRQHQHRHHHHHHHHHPQREKSAAREHHEHSLDSQNLSYHSSCGGDAVSNSCVLAETIPENDNNNTEFLPPFELHSGRDMNNMEAMHQLVDSAVIGGECSCEINSIVQNPQGTVGNEDNKIPTDIDMDSGRESDSQREKDVCLSIEVNKGCATTMHTTTTPVVVGEGDFNLSNGEKEMEGAPEQNLLCDDGDTVRNNKSDDHNHAKSSVEPVRPSEIGEITNERLATEEEKITVEQLSLSEENESTNYSSPALPPLIPQSLQGTVNAPSNENSEQVVRKSEVGDTEKVKCIVSFQKSISFSDEDRTYYPEKKNDDRGEKYGVRHGKPQLVRSPPLICEESIIARSSSEEGPKSDADEEHAEKSMIASSSATSSRNPCSSIKSSFSSKGRKHKKHVLLDLDIGGGSSISGSGGEEDTEKYKHELYRQSSGQSDESGEGDRTSDGCTSPPIISAPHTNPPLPLHRSHLSPGNSPLTEALALDPVMRRGSASAATQSTHAPTAAHSASNLHSTSLPQTSSVSGQSYFKGSNDTEGGGRLSGQRDSERMNSLSTPNVNNRQMPARRYKRPLRGPYGQMLEAEMNKPRTNQDYDSFEFLRESKSTSPSRTPQNESDKGNVCGGGNASRNTKLSTLLMSSMDDLNNLARPKHSSNRARKISANLPVSHFHSKDDGTPIIAFHQRTASSPSQLLYATSSSDQDSLAQRRQLSSTSEKKGHHVQAPIHDGLRSLALHQQSALLCENTHQSPSNNPPQTSPNRRRAILTFRGGGGGGGGLDEALSDSGVSPSNNSVGATLGSSLRRSPTPDVKRHQGIGASRSCNASNEMLAISRRRSPVRKSPDGVPSGEEEEAARTESFAVAALVAKLQRDDSSPRGHVLAEIVETEKSYVDSLRILVKKYMEPLKASEIIDNGLVDEIFFKIPEILLHHERLLDELQGTVTDDNQCIGNVLLETFRRVSLLENYSLFVNNWKNAKGSLKLAVASKPHLARFLEAQARQHKGKLTLDSLLIMPIQRIPRYELLVKELLKHTDSNHEDHPHLVSALDRIKRFAVHIDCASVDLNGIGEIEIEGWGCGLGHLVRQDVVTVSQSSNMKKERALFLFADSLVLASIKRKSTMRKPPQGHHPSNSLEGCKFKLLMRVQLTDLHIMEELDGSTSGGKASTSSSGASGYSFTHSEEKDEKNDDLKTIHKMMDLATLLKCPHVGLDEVLRELATSLRNHTDSAGNDGIDLEVKQSDQSDTPEVLKIYFGSPDKKIAWVDSFQDTVGKYIRYGFGKLPQLQFVQALPIRKTRAGLQLSCAAPVTYYSKVSKALEMTDLWVANSDGYVGQICILTLHPEPAITSCNGVCNSRITCIISVPPSCYPHWSAGTGSYHPDTFAYNHELAHQTTLCHALGYDSEDDHHRSSSKQSKNPGEHWSVWLGTEDGSLHVYDCSDSIRVKKNRYKVQHKSPLNSMIYFDRRVFVALGNGDVAVYSRNPNACCSTNAEDGKGWLVNEPSWVTIGTAMNPVTKMICVQSYIWCACGSQIKVYAENNGMLELIRTIQIVVEGNQMPRGVSAMVASDTQVWIAVQGTSIIKSYSVSNYECLTEINVAPDVVKILAGCDDIIRQHKSACLRVTALLVAPDKSLWIGTSAGVLLTIASASQLPTISHPKLSPLAHGHTGQVRFLTSCVNRETWTVISGGDGYEEFRSVPAFMNNNSGSVSSFSNMVSGLVGDSPAGDLSGREDSTNHLLIWKIPKYV